MGTYTTNYNLFMPSIGEQGWGDLVNGNFTIIDTIMKGLYVKVGILETETNTMKEKLDSIDIDEEGSVVFGSKIKFNSTITVTPSTSTMWFSGTFNILPYMFGATYSGTLKAKRPNGSGNTIFYFVSSSGTLTSQTIASDDTAVKTITIPDNTVYAYVKDNHNYASETSTLYVPLFS